MAVYGWYCVYIGMLIAWRQRGTAYRRCRTARQEGRGYACVRYVNTVYNRHHQSQSFATPGCVYRVRVRALYYYIIIILLYYYIIIFIYTQYIQYTQYT